MPVSCHVAGDRTPGVTLESEVAHVDLFHSLQNGCVLFACGQSDWPHW